jgi:hypothetical protein
VIDSNDITKALCQAMNGKAGSQYLLLTRLMISSFGCQLISEPRRVANPDASEFNAENNPLAAEIRAIWNSAIRQVVSDGISDKLQ